jgi:hypothetical protein
VSFLVASPQFVPFQLLLAANVFMVGVGFSQMVYAVSQGGLDSDSDWDFSVEPPLTCQVFSVLMIMCVVGNVAGITTVWVFVYRLLSRASELQFTEDAAVFKARATLFGLIMVAAWSTMVLLDAGSGSIGGIVCFLMPTPKNAIVCAVVAAICVASSLQTPIQSA